MTPDVNVLVAASRSDHPHHTVVIRWLKESLEACSLGQRLALLPMVAAVFLCLVTHPRVFVEPLCRQHQLVGNAISDGWIAAAVLALRQVLVTFDRDFLPLLPSRQLLLLEGDKRTFATTHPADTTRPRRGQGWRRRENLSQFLGGVITCAA